MIPAQSDARISLTFNINQDHKLPKKDDYYHKDKQFFYSLYYFPRGQTDEEFYYEESTDRFPSVIRLKADDYDKVQVGDGVIESDVLGETKKNEIKLGGLNIAQISLIIMAISLLIGFSIYVCEECQKRRRQNVR